MLTGTVKVQEKGKKKAHYFKLDKEKISQPICIKFYQPLEIMAFALVNRQLKFFTIRQTVSKLVFEQIASIRTEQMAVSMSIEAHKVTDKLLCCMGY